jgi:hypothetical protein
MGRNPINSVFAALSLVAGLMLAAPAQAVTMLGDQVTINYLFPDASTTYTGFNGLPATVTVANGTSDAVTARYGRTRLFSVNVDAGSVTLTFLRSLTFNPATFSGIQISGIGPAMSGVNLTGGGGTASISGNDLLLNLAGQSFNRRSTLTATPLFVTTPPAVPLPATLPLIAGALGLLGLFGRRGRKRGAARRGRQNARTDALLPAAARLRLA